MESHRLLYGYVKNPQNSNLKLTWQVFGGKMAEILIIALKQRCYNDGLGIEKETLVSQFRLHLHRGIGYLAADPHILKIDDLVSVTLNSSLTSIIKESQTEEIGGNREN